MAEFLIKGIMLSKYGKITLDIYPNGEVFEKRGSERIGYAKVTELLPHGELKDMKMIEKTICEYLGIKDISCLTPAERSVYNCICYTPNAVEATDG